MKTPEDEAFDEIAKRQGGFQAKRAMAADKLQEPVTEREALKLALEALKIWEHMYPKSSASPYRTPAITAIKEALAQPVQGPVAWYDKHGMITHDPFEGVTALYTASPQRPWVGLTDEDCKGMNAGDKVVAMWANRILKEKNT